MELQTAQKNFTFHGVTGIALVGVGIASSFDAAFRRTSETIQEIWMVELGVGMVSCLLGLCFLAVQCATWCTWTGLLSTQNARLGTGLLRIADLVSRVQRWILGL